MKARITDGLMTHYSAAAGNYRNRNIFFRFVVNNFR